MARQEIERPVQQSLLDRLIDLDPKNSQELPMTRAQSVRGLKNSLRRELEWLLNTRSIPEPAPRGLTEVRRSLYHYGLSDLSSMSADDSEDRLKLLRMIEQSIEMFEPRLMNVRVSESHDKVAGSRQVHFVVQALMRMDPAPEQVYFDTVLDLAGGGYEIKGE
ncbi:MAG: type VI secretion system baseplate subunit TssE [Bryobacteraceae bacterium]